MKTAIKPLLVALLVGLTISLSAQDNSKKERRQFSADDMAKRQTEQMKKELTLTGDQETKVQAINLKYAKKLEEKYKAQPADRRSMTDEQRKKMTEETQVMNTEKNTELKAVLTADQYKKWKNKMPPE